MTMIDHVRRERERRRKDLYDRLSPHEQREADTLTGIFKGYEKLAKRIDKVSVAHKAVNAPDAPDIRDFRVRTNRSLQEAEREREDFWKNIELRYGVQR